MSDDVLRVVGHHIYPFSYQQMPLINVRTNISDVQEASALLKQLSSALAAATGKPESYVMTLLDAGVPMTFAGSEKPCFYAKIAPFKYISNLDYED